MRQVLALAYSKINFIPDTSIPFQFFAKAYPLVREIDMDDIVFVALTEYLNELFWTGDKELWEGLRARGYDKVVNFQEVKDIVLF